MSEQKKKKVLLFGPAIGSFAGAYGGGTGGYTRNMSQYLRFFRSSAFQIIPCFHTVAGQGRVRSFVLRFLIDFFRFLSSMIRVRPAVVHILAQYRTATPREFAAAVWCGIFRTPYIYEVKAGSFSSWYPASGLVFKKMADYCIRHANTVLCEGKPTLDTIFEATGVSGVFFPNFVSIAEIPEEVPEKLTQPTLKVMFIGYAFKEKGIFELVEGCQKVAEKVAVEVHLIGQEHPEFKEWMDQLVLHPNLKIHRLGKLPHEEVMTHFGRNDVYCYPTRHPGEGHNNSINEAMMHGMVILTAKQGFLETVLEDTAYFLPEVSSAAVAGSLLYIADHRTEARQKAVDTRRRLLDHFTDKHAFDKLEAAYRKAAGK